jgi:hypothetical protein
MKKIIEKEFGTLVYEESFWTGKKKIILNNQELQKIDKTTFQYLDEEGKIKNLYVTGNFVAGVQARFDNQNFRITPATKWYEYVLAISGFVFMLIWSNSPALCAIFPMVGGLIGGGISGLLCATSLLLMKSTNKALFKVLIGVGMFLANVFACFIVALMIIGLYI